MHELRFAYCCIMGYVEILHHSVSEIIRAQTGLFNLYSQHECIQFSFRYLRVVVPVDLSKEAAKYIFERFFQKKSMK